MLKQRMIPAGEFKAKCLKLMDEIGEEGGELVITKRGKAIAKLVPADAVQTGPNATDRLVGCLQDSVTFHGDVVGPFHEDWRLRDES